MKYIFILFCFFLGADALAQTPSFEWAKSFGGSGSDYCYDIVLDDVGNIFCTGYFVGTVDFDPSPNVVNLTSAGQSIFISKLDPNGELIWAKALNGLSYNAGASLVLDSIGNFYLTGIFSGTVDFDPSNNTFDMTSNMGSNDVFVSKFDAFGSLLWAKRIGGSGVDGSGSIDINTGGNGDVCITGIFNGTVDFDPGPGVYNLNSVGSDPTIFICKLNSGGNLVWAKRIAGTGSKKCRQIKLDSFGNVYAVGWFQGTVDFNPDSLSTLLLSSINQDVFLLKLKSSGDLAWVKQIGGTGWDTGTSLDINSGPNDDIVMSGNFQNTVDFDPGLGNSYLTSSGDYDIFVLKMTSSGDFVWAKRMGGTSIDQVFNVIFDDNGNIFSTGHFRGFSDFDPNPTSVFTLSSIGNDDIFISKLNANGDFVWAKHVGGSGPDAGLSLETNSAGNLFITGAIHSPSVYFDLINVTNSNSAGSSEMFIAKINKYAALITYSTIENRDLFYPNPAQTTIYSNLPTGEFMVSIMDMEGRVVLGNFPSTHSIDISSLPNGVYFIQVKGQNTTSNQRIIKNE